MAKYLRSSEIIDLELFIKADKKESEDYKNNRDFDFYSKASVYKKADDVQLLSFWVEKMREISGQTSVGKLSQLVFWVGAVLLMLLGALCGRLFVALFIPNSSYVFFTLLASIFFIATYYALAKLAKYANAMLAYVLKAIAGDRADLSCVEENNKKHFEQRGKFFCQFFGLAFIISMFLATSATVASISFSNFFCWGVLIYGVLPRIFIFYKCLSAKEFGEYKILNDSDVSALLTRIKLGVSEGKNIEEVEPEKLCENLILLRSDLVDYEEILTQKAIKYTELEDFDCFNYNFLSELFEEKFDNIQEQYKSFTIAFLADDYNEEVFENMQTLSNTYPEKILNVLLLGSYDKAGKSFDEPVPVNKSWWQRKLNAISSQNINIY